MATALNDFNVVAGNSDLPGEFAPFHAFVFSNGTMQDLGRSPGAISVPRCLSTMPGDIAGFSFAPDGSRGFVYRNGQMIDIGSLGSGISEIFDLNENGHVVGSSMNEDFLGRAFL